MPGIGSYMSVAQEQNDGWAQVYAVVAMILMIVAIDQLIWRPLIVWSNKFKIEDTEAEYQDRSAVLRFFSRSRVVAWIAASVRHACHAPGGPARAYDPPHAASAASRARIWRGHSVAARFSWALTLDPDRVRRVQRRSPALGSEVLRVADHRRATSCSPSFACWPPSA